MYGSCPGKQELAAEGNPNPRLNIFPLCRRRGSFVRLLPPPSTRLRVNLFIIFWQVQALYTKTRF